MKQDEVLKMPAVLHEAAEERNDRKNKRLWLVIMALIGVIAGLLFLEVTDGESDIN
jgi:hypothetical protein